MDDLLQFLRARLDEDELIARDASVEAWTKAEAPSIFVMSVNGLVAETSAFTDARHIARHDPARVLAEVDVKRQLVDASAVDCPPDCGIHGQHTFSGSCALRSMGPAWDENGRRWLPVWDKQGSLMVHLTGQRIPAPPVTPEHTLLLLALPYASHPDYRAEWRVPGV